MDSVLYFRPIEVEVLRAFLYGLCPNTKSRWGPVQGSSYTLFIATTVLEPSATKKKSNYFLKISGSFKMSPQSFYF